MTYSRRKLLAAGASAGLAGIAGCIDLFGEHSDWDDWASEETIDARDVTLYQGENCTCCTRYADYLDEHLAGELAVSVLEDPTTVKDDHAIPEHLRSCHTVLIDETVFEGHLPVETIIGYRSDEDGPGIALPGMPEHSPGMGSPGSSYLTVYHLDGTEYTTI